MVFDVSVAVAWILFMALFPISFIWLRRCWRIVVKRDFRDVALKRGEPPANPAKFAPFAALINLLGAVVLLVVIVGVVGAWFHYQTWSAIAGLTVWFKLLADFILSRQAHAMAGR